MIRLMQKVDAKAEIDSLFNELGDVVHFIGTTRITNARGDTRKVAFARLVFSEDATIRPWPEALIYNHSVEVLTGIRMFSIYEPGKFMEPFLTTEWHDSCDDFAQAAKELGIFMLEIVTPKVKRSAMVVDAKVKHATEVPITPDDYNFLSNAYIPPTAPPTS